MPTREAKGSHRFGVLIAMAALCLMPASAQAAVITPNTTADEYDTVPNSSCSLREAVQTLNTVSDFGGCTHTGTFASGDTIELPGGDYVLTIEPTGSDLNSSGDLNTFGTVTIEAAPGARVTIDGNAKDRVLNASIFGVTVTLRGLTITNGVVGTPESNTGVIGGGIFSSSGTNLVISDSTISNNTSDGGGGGIDANGPTTLTNVTISGNSATDSEGGGLEATGTTLSLDHVTMTNNRSGATGPANQSTAGGLYNNTSGSATVHNSIIAGNTSESTDFPAPDCQGASLTSQGGNVIGDDTGCSFTPVSSDDVGTTGSAVDPLLGPLADNGGTTFTHALLTGSPAIDRGVPTCASADQRGYPRPFGASCDSGAYELFTCGGTPLNAPGSFAGCPGPPSGPLTTTPLPVDRCAPLRKKLKKAKRAHKTAKVRKLKKKLRKLGC